MNETNLIQLFPSKFVKKKSHSKLILWGVGLCTVRCQVRGAGDPIGWGHLMVDRAEKRGTTS